jgi:hypothetical protein
MWPSFYEHAAWTRVIARSASDEAIQLFWIALRCLSSGGDFAPSRRLAMTPVVFDRARQCDRRAREHPASGQDR